MSPRTPLDPYPNGWYVFGFSDELPNGKLLARPFMGQEVVVFRTASGRACAADAYCPHLGAHFGFGGTVEGECLRCPFHGFCYGVDGACVKTGYGTRPPPAAKLRVWPLRETNGMLLVYYHARQDAPTWEVPALDPAGWTPMRYAKYQLADHPQETTENSVDLGHFAFVHGYRNPRMLREAATDGPYLTTTYAVSRDLPGTRRLFDFEFETHIYGLGYSLVNVRVPLIKAQARLWVLPTALDEAHIILHLAASLKVMRGSDIHPLLLVVPPRWLSQAVLWGIFQGFTHDASQDFPIWQHKRYVSPPALAEGDGPIGKYRQWARQFYSA